MRKTIIKNEKGITLIALVITIIVLLILAGVAISMLTGENGLINQAVASKTQTEKQSAIEEIRLAYLSALTGGQGEINYDILNEELAKVGYDRGNKGEDNSYSNDITSLPKKVTINDVTYEIKADGVVGVVENLNSTDLAYSKNYYMSGNTNGQYVYLNSNGAIKTTLLGAERDATYTIEDEYIKFNLIDFFTQEEQSSFDAATLEAYKNMKYEFKIVKEENNDLLTSDGANMLLATSTEGLKYITNGEKYVCGESYIIFNENGYNFADGNTSGSGSPSTVVYYDGVIYSGNPTYPMTTTDNCETINWKGKTYTKSAE